MLPGNVDRFERFHTSTLQVLKSRANYIAVPLILMNALNSALSASTITSLPYVVSLGEFSRAFPPQGCGV